jgi:hypothetical protein
MSFIDDSEKNVEFIKEVSGGAVGGFVGRSGMGIDRLFAGPYHPDSGHGSKNKQLLLKQLKDRREKRKDLTSDRDDVIDDYSGLPDPVGGYYDVDTENVKLAYDELERYNQLAIDYNIEKTPPADVEWKSNSWDYEFDEIIPYIEEEDFINTSETNMAHINLDLDYDEFDSSMGRDRRNRTFDEEDFVEKSETNIENTIKEEEIQLNEEDFINRSEINLKTIYKNDIGLSIHIGG